MLTEPEFVENFYRDEIGLDSDAAHSLSSTFISFASIARDIFQQYARRIVFYDADLFFKSIDKVSFKDLFLNDDFSHEDLTKFALYFADRLGFRLMWFKDAALEALAMSKGDIVANIGKLSKWHLHGEVQSHVVQIAEVKSLGDGSTTVRTRTRFLMKLGGQVLFWCPCAL